MREPDDVDSDAVLATLRRACSHTQPSSSDRVKIQLAIELRSHYLSERHSTSTRHTELQQQLDTARSQYTQALNSQARDISQLHRLTQSNVWAQKLASGKKSNAKESLQFSNMMVDSAKHNVEKAERELAEYRRQKERRVERLQSEAALAVRACEEVLASVPDRKSKRIDDLQISPPLSVDHAAKPASRVAGPRMLAKPPPVPVIRNAKVAPSQVSPPPTTQLPPIPVAARSTPVKPPRMPAQSNGVSPPIARPPPVPRTQQAPRPTIPKPPRIPAISAPGNQHPAARPPPVPSTAVQRSEQGLAQPPRLPARPTHDEKLSLAVKLATPPTANLHSGPTLAKPPRVPTTVTRTNGAAPTLDTPSHLELVKPLLVPPTKLHSESSAATAGSSKTTPPRSSTKKPLPVPPAAASHSVPVNPKPLPVPVLKVTEASPMPTPFKSRAARSDEGLKPPESAKRAARKYQFKIATEDRHQSALVSSQQQRFQAQLPPALLVELKLADSADTARDLLFDCLGPPLRSMLELCFADIHKARLVKGLPGFGADAYLELHSADKQRPFVRVPISILGNDFGGPPSRHTRVSGKQAVQMCFGPALVHSRSSMDAAIGAVLRSVQLICTEPRARNLGVLVLPAGLLFVRRTQVQSALVSRLHPFTNPDVELSSFWCHPVAAIGCVVAQLVAAGPTTALDPPAL
ncbi:hypothetical protein LPJ63_003452 [Coemansia sp. RSA 2711]|nr:hypothetical protein LPJ63_003452 [Coemansia sp. RSA 2711]